MKVNEIQNYYAIGAYITDSALQTKTNSPNAIVSTDTSEREVRPS